MQYKGLDSLRERQSLVEQKERSKAHVPLPTGCREGGPEEGERNVPVEVSSEPRWC